MNTKKIAYTVNARGRRIGQSHHLSTTGLTDENVASLLDLRDEGYSWRWLAETFEISMRHARDIYAGRRRCQTPFTKTRIALAIELAYPAPPQPRPVRLIKRPEAGGHQPDAENAGNGPLRPCAGHALDASTEPDTGASS